MARRGLFGTNATSGNVAGSVIKNILQMQGTGETAAEPGTTDGTKTNTPRVPLTAEQISKSAVLSGRLSYDQSRVNMIKYMRAVNKMPSATTTGKKYDKQLARAQKAIDKFGPNASQIEQNFYALGGKLNDDQGGYGMSAKKILDYWRSAGMEEKGREIVSKLRGYDQYGNDIPGGIDTSKNIDFTYGNEGQINMKSPTKGLNTLQAARFTKLQNLKKSGATLGPKQLANIKRLRALAKG
jgi:hypothetical protein